MPDGSYLRCWIIFVFGCAGGSRYRAEAGKAGTHAYLIKPFDFNGTACGYYRTYQLTNQVTKNKGRLPSSTAYIPDNRINGDLPYLKPLKVLRLKPERETSAF